MPSIEEKTHDELDVLIGTQKWVVVSDSELIPTVVGPFNSEDEADGWRDTFEPNGYVLPIIDPTDQEFARFAS